MNTSPNLDTLTADTLAHVLSFLNVHMMMRSIPLTCKALYAASLDPVVWAKMIISPCCYDELSWLVRKFPSITVIGECPFVVEDCHYREIAAACPQLRYFEGIFASLGDCGLPLQRVVCGSYAVPTTATLRTSLTTLVIAVELDAATLDVLSAECVHITTVYAAALGMITNFPSHFPQLTALDTVEGSIESAHWEEFVNSHIGLRSLCMCLEERYIAVDSSVMPTSLTSLVVLDCITDVVYPLVTAVVKASPSLRIIYYDGTVSDELFYAMADCGSLSSVTLREFQSFSISEDNVAAMAAFAENVSLESLVLDAWLPDRCREIVLRALGNIKEIPSYFTLDDGLVMALCDSQRLVNVRALSLRNGDTLSVGACQVLSKFKVRYMKQFSKLLTLHESTPTPAIYSGANLRALQSVTLNSNTNFTEAHYEALVPAVLNVRELNVIHGSKSMRPMVKAAAMSSRLAVLRLDNVDVLDAFLEEWNGGVLKTFSFSGRQLPALQTLLAAVRSGRLAASRFYVTGLYMEPPSKEVAAQISAYGQDDRCAKFVRVE